MKLKYVVWILFGAMIVFACDQQEKELPIFNPSDFNPKLVDISLQKTTKDHTVSDFELWNQNGERITQEDYKDKIYVADFFFTRCQTICPIMSANIGQLQELFLKDDEVKFLSMSVTPTIDSVSVLRAYATEKGVNDAKWNLTTGSKKHIYELARKSYFAVVDEGDGGLQDFIHTTHFVLVDKKRRIRGIYDGTEDEEINRLADDIRILQKKSIH